MKNKPMPEQDESITEQEKKTKSLRVKIYRTKEQRKLVSGNKIRTLALGLGTTAATMFGSPSKAEANTPLRDKPPTPTENTARPNASSVTNANTLYISNMQETDFDLSNANLLLDDDLVYIQDLDAFFNATGIDVEDIQLSIPDGLLTAEQLNEVVSSPITEKMSKYAARTNGHKGLCTGDIKGMFQQQFRKRILDNEAWGQVVYSDQFYNYVKAGKLKGFVAFQPNQDIVKQEIDFATGTTWFRKKIGPKNGGGHTGYHPKRRKMINEEDKINAWNEYNYRISPRSYGTLGLYMPNADIMPVLQKHFALVYDKNNKTIIVMPEISQEMAMQIEMAKYNRSIATPIDDTASTQMKNKEKAAPSSESKDIAQNNKNNKTKPVKKLKDTHNFPTNFPEGAEASIALASLGREKLRKFINSRLHRTRG